MKYATLNIEPLFFSVQVKLHLIIGRPLKKSTYSIEVNNGKEKRENLVILSF